MHLRQLEGVSFVNRRYGYTKGVPFLSKMVCKRIREGGKVGGPSLYNTLLSAPLAHYVLQREAVCSFAACYCHIVSFLLFIVFNWNASIFLASKSSVHPFGYFSCETSRGSVRPIKTFLHDRFFPCTLHPRRPRGSQSGREKRRDESFQVQAKSPWVPTLTEPFPKIQADAGS